MSHDITITCVVVDNESGRQLAEINHSWTRETGESILRERELLKLYNKINNDDFEEKDMKRKKVKELTPFTHFEIMDLE